MIREVIVLPRAEEDLTEIALWITDRADEEIAIHYVRRIRKRISALENFPLKGSPRRYSKDLRSISFERRIVIFYRVDDDAVRVVRIVGGARDLKAVFSER